MPGLEFPDRVADSPYDEWGDLDLPRSGQPSAGTDGFEDENGPEVTLAPPDHWVGGYGDTAQPQPETNELPAETEAETGQRRFEVPTGITLHLPSERTARFDRLAGETAQLAGQLRPGDFHPEVRPAVRGLKTAIGNLAVATVENGVARLSPDQEHNGAAVVQLLPGEDSIKLAPSLLFRATPGRIAQTAERYGLSETLVAETFRAAQRHAEENPNNLGDLTVGQNNARTRAVSFFGKHPNPDFPIPIHFQAQPIMILRPGVEPPTVLHEGVHIFDLEELWKFRPLTDAQELDLAAQAELRAHHVGATSARGTPYTNSASNQKLVERLRTMYGKNGGFGTTPRLINELIKARAIAC